MQRFPLHRAISNNYDKSIRRTIAGAHRRDPTSLVAADDLGLTPVHIAALRMNAHAMEALLELGVREVLCETGDAERDRRTPLSLCTLTICIMEAAVEPSTEFAGYCEGGLRVEGMLKRAMGVLPPDMDPVLYAMKYKWGCTCGRCLGGWLSPRMRFRLQGQSARPGRAHRASRRGGRPRSCLLAPVQADHVFDDGTGVANATMYDLLPGTGTSSRADRVASALRFIPPNAASNPPPRARTGFWQVVAAVSRLLQLSEDGTDALERDYAIPTSESVCAVLEPGHVWARAFDEGAVRAFWEMGGKVEWALDCVTALAMRDVRVFEALVKGGKGGGGAAMGYAVPPEERWKSLPLCANDLDWVVVRQNLGLSPREQWGPYWGAEGI